MNRRRVLLRAGTLAALGGAATRGIGEARAQDASRAFAFALIGDIPYSDADEAVLAAVLGAIDADALSFVVHVGDIKGSREPCSDALYARRAALLARSAHPLVLLPGDNEWTDCHRLGAGGHDPLERLAALRARFFSGPDPLGGPPGAAAALGFERQPGQPENVRWRVGDVHFVGLHVVGSGNGLEGPAARPAEFDARMRANRRWLDETVARALDRRADALVIAAHADPDFGALPEPGFAAWIGMLRDAAEAFRQPIMLLHGDSHRFKVDRPLVDRHGAVHPHVTRVICFGWPFAASWVRIGYDASLPRRFSVTVREPRRPAGP